MSEHFFSRWSKRKQAVAKGLPPEEALATGPVRDATSAPAAKPGPNSPPLAPAGALPASAPPTRTDSQDPAAPALPSLDDTRALTPASDFQPFMQQGVSADVRNAAVKKLFTDPHFNVMDGLDIYISDYNTPDPLPAGMLEKMVGAQLLNLFSKPGDDAGPAASAGSVGAEPRPDAAEGLPVVAQSPQAQTPHAQQTTSVLQASVPSEHDHPDLQLQPNHAPAGPDSGSSTG